MKLGILFMGLGLIVCTYAYGIDQGEDSGILNPAAEPSAPTRTRRPHTGAFPSHLTTPSSTSAKNGSVAQGAASTARSVAAPAKEYHDQQSLPSETDENVVPPVYSQSAYEIQLEPFGAGVQREQQYGSGSVGGPPPLGSGYDTSAPPQAPLLPARPSHSSLHPIPSLPPPPPLNHGVVINHGASYNVPAPPAVPPPHGHHPVTVPAYHSSWSAPTQPLSSHTSSSSSSSFSSSYGHQQVNHNDEHSSIKDEHLDDSGEIESGREENSGGAFSISFTAPAYAPAPVSHPLIPTYQLPHPSARPIHQAPQQYEPPRHELPKIPQYEPPRFPQYSTPSPALQPQYPPPIPPATLPQYEPVRSPAPAYQVVAVEAEPANAAYPSPAAPSYVEEVYPDDLSAIPGRPGQDYPQMAKIPQSSFNCGDKLPGYYADLDSQCQVWHFCDMSGRRESFLCPNGTLYNQEKFVCDWWYNVDCGLATSFFVRNEELYKVPVRTPVVQYQPVVPQQQGQYQQQEQHRGHQQQEQHRGHQQQEEHHGQQQGPYQQFGHQQQQGHYQQQDEQLGHQQQQQEQHREHYGQQEQHRHKQFQSVSSSHDSGYGHEPQQTGVHVSSYSVTQEHPSAPPHLIVTKQEPQVTHPTPSYISQSSTVATPVRVIETKHSNPVTEPTYGQTITSSKPQLEESESHIQSSY